MATVNKHWLFIGEFQGNKEKSFLISNISKKDLVKLANEYDQAFVIFAKKMNKGYSVEWLDKKSHIVKKENVKNIRSLISKAKNDF